MNINIYDFDGVLACPIEDAVFRLDPNTLDKEFIQRGRERYGITKLSEKVQRNRHLILQEVLYERKIPCRDGPIRPFWADPFYVLTARSGPGAVARVSAYVENIGLRPEEMFFVGPMSKTHCLIDLCEKFPNAHLTFWDDNMFHIEDGNGLGFANLTCNFVDNKVPTLFDEAMDFYEDQFKWLRNQ